MRGRCLLLILQEQIDNQGFPFSYEIQIKFGIVADANESSAAKYVYPTDALLIVLKRSRNKKCYHVNMLCAN